MKMEINEQTIEFIETTMKPIQFLGIKVCKIAERYCLLSMPLDGNTSPNNIMFGGYLFAMADFIMGPIWVVSFPWKEMYNTSKTTTIVYKKPVESDVTAELLFSEKEVKRIIDNTRSFGKCDFTFDVVIRDKTEDEVAIVTHNNQMRLIK